jgi:hypothetical protein
MLLSEQKQQMFLTSFYCYLNYHPTNDFVIDLDDVWKWLGFSQKIRAKELLEKYDLDLDKFINDDYFYPQTNFYFINVSKTDYLNDAHYINETYNYTKSLNNYNGRVWEYIENWSCEKFLKDCVERNNLKIEHLLMGSTYISLLNFIKDQKCQDPSHKNIMMENICHLHFPEQNIIYI